MNNKPVFGLMVAALLLFGTERLNAAEKKIDLERSILKILSTLAG